MNPALSQEFNNFCEQEQLQKHATLDKNPYGVYGTLKSVTKSTARFSHENLAEKKQIFVQDFVPIRTALRGYR